MSLISTRVSNRIKTSRTVLAAIDVHGAAVASDLSKAHPELAPEQVSAALASLGAILRRSTSALESAEQAYTAEQADDPAARAVRDAAAQEAYGLALRARAAVEAGLGSEAAGAYGLTGDTPREPERLRSYLVNALQLMRSKPARQDDAFGGGFDSDRIVTALQPAVDALDAALAGTAAEARELQLALRERDRVLDAWQADYVGVATAFEGLLRLAGARDLAQRIRPTMTRAAGEVADVAPVEPVTPEPVTV